MNQEASRRSPSAARFRRGPIVLIALCAALLALALAAAPALAVSPRSYDSQIVSPKAPSTGSILGIDFDASENIWLDYAENGNTFEEPSDGFIFKFSPYPTSSLLSEFSSEKFHRANCSPSANNRSIGISRSTGNVYVAIDGCGGILEFTPSGTLIGELPLYNAKPERGGAPEIAVDNSGGPTNGHVLSAMGFGDESVGFHSYILGLDANLSPVKFSGEKPYIKGPKIIGTPGGNFGFQSLGSITTDKSGNFYVLEGEKQAVEEFNAAGEFAREFTSAGVPGGIGSHFDAGGLAVDPTTGDLLVVNHTTRVVNEFSPTGTYLRQITGAETPGGTFANPTYVAVDPNGFLFVVDSGNGVIDVFNPAVVPPKITNEEVTNQSDTAGTLNATVDPNTAGNIVSCKFEYGTAVGSYGLGTKNCNPDPASAPPGSNFTVPTQVHADLTGLTPETQYHYRVVAENAIGTVAKGGDQVYTPHYVHSLRTDPASAVGGTGATLNGSFIGNGSDTHYYFEWGKTTDYGQRTSAPPGLDAGGPTGPGRTSVAAAISGLEPLTKYHYRIVAGNSFGSGHGLDGIFTTGKSAPLVKEGAIDVHADGATLAAQIDAGGEETTYHFEWGTEDCETSICTVLPTQNIGSAAEYQSVSFPLTGLTPETTYHFRVVAHNGLGDSGYDTTFTTFPAAEPPIENCPNSLARQQTGSALLLDCRAYELVSATDSGGYDVESDLVPGQKPYGGYPQASGAEGTSRLLYGIHNGAIPGVAGNPTNKEVDPYIATRGANSWTTTYVGVAANDPFASGPFSSVPSGTDASLTTFAFGTPGGCSPCFANGYTGTPLHLPSGEIVQGMVSSGVTAPNASSKVDGYVAKDLSADGTHFVFGSTSQFAPGGNNSIGEISIYDRDLKTGETHVVSNSPAGAALACIQGSGACHSPGDGDGIGELDISNDGSRIVLGQKVSTDAEGNVYWHLYMDIGDAAQSVDLTPNATQGVLYDGMTGDGSKVFFTTRNALAGATPVDDDTSADIYEAEVSGAGGLNLTRISAGAAGNVDSCDPVENSVRTHWNTVGLSENCDALAVGGGGGVASGDGTVYFLSPEQLEAGQGTLNQPNLYVAQSGAAPRFVATLDPNDPVVVDALSAEAARRTTDFQTSPNGNFAVFPTVEKLVGGHENYEHLEVYRYSTAGGLDCASCNPTNAQADGDATLASNGSSLSDDGRVFFNSPDPLVIRDADHRQDVYEWKNGAVQLISAGSGSFASSLLSVSADGTDTFFFTHDTLATQDHNGPVTKIYDARTNGGFFEIPSPPPCAASDECHGPSSEAPGPPTIRTVTGKPGNPMSSSKCRKGLVKKHGSCVKPHRHHHRKHRRHGHG